MYNLIEYSNNDSKTCGNLWEYFRDQPAVSGNVAITESNPTKFFNSKAKITAQKWNNGRKDVKRMVPLKYLSNFWKTPEMLNWSDNCVIVSTVNANQDAIFSILPVVS